MYTAQAAILKKTKGKPDLPLLMGCDNDHLISSHVIARSYCKPSSPQSCVGLKQYKGDNEDEDGDNLLINDDED